MPVNWRIYGQPIGIAARDFLTWWLAELRALLPEKTRFSEWEKGVRLHIGDNGVEVMAISSNAGEKWQNPEQWESWDAQDWAQLRDIIGDGTASIILDNHQRLWQDFSLPNSAKGHEQQAVALHMEKALPFDSGLYHWGWVKGGKEVQGERKSGTFTLYIAIAKRDILDELGQKFADNGLEKPDIYAANDNGLHALLVKGENRAAKLAQQRWILTIVMVCAAFFTALLVTIMWAQMQSDYYQEQAALLREQLAPKLAAQRDIAQHNRMAAMVQPVARQAIASNILEELAIGLPEHVWITRLSYGGNGVLEGVLAYSSGRVNSKDLGYAMEDLAFLRDVQPISMGQNIGNAAILDQPAGGGALPAEPLAPNILAPESMAMPDMAAMENADIATDRIEYFAFQAKLSQEGAR